MSRRHRWRRRAAALLVAVCAISTSCGYHADEPGLFGPRPTDAETTSRSLPRRAPAGVLLPVAGEAVWSARLRGTPVQIRVGVHAVRRITGGTVLDWSLTPLRDQMTPIGSRLPDDVVAALGSATVHLIDPGRRLRYAPLTDRGTEQCLCTRLDPTVARLRAGGTSLMQTVFPPLPASLASVDVVIPLVPVVTQVPVAPAGRLPRTRRPADLARPEHPAAGQATTPTFTVPPARQQFQIELGPVVTSDASTSIAWRVRAVTEGPGLADGRRLPVPTLRQGPHDPVPGSTAAGPAGPDPSSAGPPVALDGPATASGSATADAWTPMLRLPDDQIELVTTAPRKAATQHPSRTDVTFPGLVAISGVSVAVASPASTPDSSPQPYRPRFWPDPDPPAPLAVSYWPTAVPAPQVLADAASRAPERL